LTGQTDVIDLEGFFQRVPRTPWVAMAMEKLYSVRDLGRLFGFKAGRIRYWDKIEFLTPSVRIGARKYYTSQDLIGMRTSKGLLDAGLPFAKVRRSVIDAKRVSTEVKKDLSRPLIRGDGEEGGSDPAAIGSNAMGQALIGFSHRDFEGRMQAASRQLGPNITSEIEESGASHKTTSTKRGPIKPEEPR
jgi:DNA-binding transcriptional MerR regulator